MRAPSREAIQRRIKTPDIEELLTRPLKKTDPRRLPRSMPGMVDWLTTPYTPKSDMIVGKLNRELAHKDKSNPVRRA